MMPKFSIYRTALIVIALTISISANAIADSPKPVNVPAGDLTAALELLQKQSGVEIVYRPELLKGVRTGGVKGTLSPEEAVTKLLKGTTLKLRSDRTGLLLISTSGADGAALFAPEGRDRDERPSTDRLLLARSDQGQTQNSVSTTPQTAQSNGLEEIVVTATKHEEGLSKVPISIVAMTREAMQASGAKSIEDIAALVPGVTFDSGSTGTLTNIAIRGISTTYGDATTGVYLDDTAIQARVSNVSAFGYPLPLTFDVDRVEVARGPQGTLFGAGAEGGTLRFIMTEPSLTEFSGFTHAEVAGTEGGGLSYETGVAGGGPLVEDELGFRGSLWYRRDGGFIDRVDPITGAIVEPDSNRSDKMSGRLALKYAASDSVTITPSIYYQSTPAHDSSMLWLYLSSVPEGHLNNGALIRQPIDDSFYLGTVKVDAKLGVLSLTAVTSYFDRHASILTDSTAFSGALQIPGPLGWGDPRGPAFPTSYSDLVTQPASMGQNMISQEIRVTSTDPADAFTWVGGVFYSRSRQLDKAVLLGASIDSPPSDPIYNAQTESIDAQYALFGQADLKLGDGWKLTGGLRASRTQFNVEQISTGLIEAGTPPLFTGNQSETPVTPKVALSYQATENTLLYVSAAKGYRIGGVNSPIPSFCGNVSAPLTFQSDSVWSYEIGAKSLLFDRHLQIDASAFHIKWENIQTPAFLSNCGFQYVDNDGGATSNGFDLALRALLTEGLSIGVSASYTNSRFDQTVESDGQPIVEKNDSVGVLPQVPSPWNVTTSLDYEIPLAGGERLYGHAEDEFHSRNPGPFAAGQPGFSYAPLLTANPSTNVVNLRLGLRWPRYDLSLFVNNATDSLPTLYRSQDTATSTLFYGRTFRPRTVGLTGNWKF
jgi:outer membrane receptor protein involved in Fe transport